MIISITGSGAFRFAHWLATEIDRGGWFFPYIGEVDPSAQVFIGNPVREKNGIKVELPIDLSIRVEWLGRDDYEVSTNKRTWRMHYVNNEGFFLS